MHYDVISKRLLEAEGGDFLRLFLGMEVDSAEPVRELPRETVAIGSTDFVFGVKKDGEHILVLLEFQTFWDKRKPGRFALNYQRMVEKYPDISVVPFLVLFNFDRRAKGRYNNNYLTFRFHLVRLWKLAAAEYLNAPPALLPFVTLMDGGTRILNELDLRIFRETGGLERADYLVGLAIFLGMRDPEAARDYIGRRRDIMRESIAYEILKEEGLEEGRREGFKQGMEQGIEQGTRAEAMNVARRMFTRGYSREEVLELTGLSAEEYRDVEPGKD